MRFISVIIFFKRRNINKILTSKHDIIGPIVLTPTTPNYDKQNNIS